MEPKQIRENLRRTSMFLLRTQGKKRCTRSRQSTSILKNYTSDEKIGTPYLQAAIKSKKLRLPLNMERTIIKIRLTNRINQGIRKEDI